MTVTDSESNVGTQGQTAAPAEYTVSGTKYTVNPVFIEDTQKESIETKVQRLILQDKQKSANTL